MARGLRHIGLFFPPTLGYFADVVMGVQEFARGEGNWSVEVCQNLPIARAVTRQWRPDGALVNLSDGDWAPLLKQLDIPVVQVGGAPSPSLPGVLPDDSAIGKLAASHLLDCGFRNLAFCGYRHLAWSTQRADAFRLAIQRSGRNCDVLLGGLGEISTQSVASLLAPWIRRLSKPVAIFACHDRVAMLVGNACSLLNLKVPDEVAILGVDNNPLECGFTAPPLSSVMGSARRIGYQAAELLCSLMRGAKVKNKPILVAPAGVAARASTDVLATDDPDLAAALRFIRANAGEPIDVSDVAEATLVSRRMLERKFQTALDRSPRQQILISHIELAQTLLIDTTLSTLAVAMRSGFPSGSKFSAVFKRETGLAPTTFRSLYGNHSKH
jgi:LacI family transcriptional regulator